MTDPADDATVADDCRLFRRIPLQPSHVLWDNTHGKWIISSAAFRNAPDSDSLSVDLEDTMNERGLSIEHVVLDRSKYAVAAIAAGSVRTLQQRIQQVPELDNPAHGHVVGEKPKPVQRSLAAAAERVEFPEHWPLL